MVSKRRRRSKQFHIDVESLLNLPSGLSFFWKDLDSHYLGCNEVTAEILRFNSRKDIEGVTDFDLSKVPAEAKIIINEDKKIISTSKPAQFSHKFTTLHDVVLNMRSFKGPLFDENRNVIGIYGINNITNRHDLKTSLNLLMKAGESANNIRLSQNHNLTRRQQECLYYLVRGKTMQGIADTLGLSAKTIEHYLENIKNKLHCNSRTELIARALQMDFIRDNL